MREVRKITCVVKQLFLIARLGVAKLVMISDLGAVFRRSNRFGRQSLFFQCKIRGICKIRSRLKFLEEYLVWVVLSSKKVYSVGFEVKRTRIEHVTVLSDLHFFNHLTRESVIIV